MRVIEKLVDAEIIVWVVFFIDLGTGDHKTGRFLGK